MSVPYQCLAYTIDLGQYRGCGQPMVAITIKLWLRPTDNLHSVQVHLYYFMRFPVQARPSVACNQVMVIS